MISFYGFIGKKDSLNIADPNYNLSKNLNENVIEEKKEDIQPLENVIENVIENKSHLTEEKKEDIRQFHHESFTQNNIVENSGYKLYRDKLETFSCEVEIFGADINTSKSRLVIETDNLTYLFEGSIDNQGKCKIPLKKMNFLNEYDSGKIKLEIIAEDTLFVPWESNFIAVNSKKVQVKIQNSDNQDPKIGISVKNITNG
jgi:hypothetical protein